MPPLYIRTCIVTILLLGFSAIGSGQNSYKSLLDKWEEFESKEQFDSALHYAYQLKQAALREYGVSGEARYFKSYNTIANLQMQTGQPDLAIQTLHEVYGLMRVSGIDSFPRTASYSFELLYKYYLGPGKNPDSASFYASKMLSIDKLTEWGTGRARINALANLAFEFEKSLGYAAARNWYLSSLEERTHVYGQKNSALVLALDSMLQLFPRDYNQGVRFLLYSCFDESYSLQQLDSMAKGSMGAEDWSSIQYASLLKDELMAATGESSPGFIGAMEQLANGLLDFGDRPDMALYCLHHVQPAIDQFPDHKTQWLKAVSYAYMKKDDFPLAIEYAGKYIEQARSSGGKNSESYIRALLYMGEVQRLRCKIDDSCSRLSSRFISEAIRNLESRNDRSIIYGDALYQQATTFLRFAGLDSAEKYYMLAYRVYEKEKADLYMTSKQLYYVYMYDDDFGKMQYWLKKCIKMAEGRGEELDEALTNDIYSLAEVYLELRDWDQASAVLDRYYNRIKVHGTNTRGYQNYIFQKIEIALRRGKTTGLDTLSRKLLDMIGNSNVFLVDTPEGRKAREQDYGLSLLQLARVYLAQERFTQALKTGYDAWHHMKNAGYDTVMTNNAIFRVIAESQFMLGQKDSAIQTAGLLGKIMDKANWKNSIYYFRNQQFIASMLAANDQQAAAEKLMYQAIEDLRDDMVQKLTGYNERQKILYTQLLRENLDKYQSLLHEMLRSADPGVTARGYEAVIRSKGILLETSRFNNMASNDSLQKIKDWLDTARVEYARINSAADLPANVKARMSKNLSVLMAELEEQISMYSTGFGKFSEENKTRLSDVREKLRSGDAAIEFTGFHYYDNLAKKDSVIYAAYVVRAQDPGVQYVPLQLNSRQVELLALQSQQARGLIKKSSASTKDVFRQLYSSCWKKLEAQLDGVSRIYISTDGILNKLSFAALQDEKGNYLVDKYELIQVSNTRDLLTIQEIPKLSEASVALFGGSVYDRQMKNPAQSENRSRSLPDQLKGKKGWDYLSGTLAEVNAIARNMKTAGWKTSLLTGPAASERNFKKLSGKSPALLHIATHGFYFAPDSIRTELDPLFRSGLIFSGANHAWLGNTVDENEEDGILTAYEISNLDLSKTQLAVLSACETGMGDILNGEGVYGLQRALKNSGVRYMILSLWPVPDKETAEMMNAFYLNLSRNTDIRKAFRSAIQLMRKKYPADPSSWGAFQLIE